MFSNFTLCIEEQYLLWTAKRTLIHYWLSMSHPIYPPTCWDLFWGILNSELLFQGVGIFPFWIWVILDQPLLFLDCMSATENELRALRRKNIMTRKMNRPIVLGYWKWGLWKVHWFDFPGNISFWILFRAVTNCSSSRWKGCLLIEHFPLALGYLD